MGLRGSRRGVLNVRRSASMITKVLDHLFQWYRLKVVSLYAGVKETVINLPILYHLMAVEMAVNIALVVALQTIGMHGDVREDQAARDGAVTMVEIGPANVGKVLQIKPGWKSVMIASN